MVALNEQLHHNDTQPRLQGTGYGLQRVGISVDVCRLHGPRTTDQKFGSSDDLFIDHCSLIFERSAGANDIIFCGYRYDPETELYFVLNRTYNSIPGTVLRQGPKSRQATGVAARVLQRDPIGYSGGVNLYEYVGGRATVGLDPTGTVTSAGVNLILATLKSELEKATAIGRGVHRIREAIQTVEALGGSQKAEKAVTGDILDFLLGKAKEIDSGDGGDPAGAQFGAALEYLKLELAIAGVIYGPATRSTACNDCEMQDALNTHPAGAVFPSGTTAYAIAFAFGIPVYFLSYEIMCRKDCQGHMDVLMWVNQNSGYQWISCGF